eukprot:2028406-Amphidinium_carterae.1
MDHHRSQPATPCSNVSHNQQVRAIDRSPSGLLLTSTARANADDKDLLSSTGSTHQDSVIRTT